MTEKYDDPVAWSEKKAIEEFDKKHNQLDFFVADLVDVAPKSDRHSMEHPMFSLSKSKDIKIREYKHGDTEITITPSVLGMATIWDKDILIYCASQIAAAGSGAISRRIRIDSYSLLSATERGTGGKNYESLTNALERLAGTRIKTTIKTGGLKETEGFGFIDSWRVAETNPRSGKMVTLELELSKWLFRAFASNGNKEILTLNQDYFHLTGGLERSIYLLARKHVGDQQNGWRIKIENLHKKTGASSTFRQFKSRLKKLVERDQLPDYSISYDSDTTICFAKRSLLPKQG